MPNLRLIMNRSTTLRAVLHALPLLLCPAAAHCAESPWATGVDATIEASAGLHGGAERGGALHGLALIHTTWTPATPAEGAGYSGYLSFLGLTGHGPTERYLGDYLTASNIEGYRSVRLYSWWLQAVRGEWSLRGGALLADEEFAGSGVGAHFFNSAFGWPAFISANTVNTGPAFYVAAPGLRLERTWGETAAWRIGVYDGDSFDSPAGDPRVTRHGLHYQLGGAQGWFVITEADLTLTGGTTHLKFGAWAHTATFPDLRDDDDGQPFALTGRDPRAHGSNHGTYGVLEHVLAGESGKPGALEAHLRAGFAPTDRNAIRWALDAGVSWTGPLPGRPADVLALGLAHARFGSSYIDQARLADPAAAAPDYEQVIELTYAAHLSDRVTVQPDLQFVRHPGGCAALDDAVAVFVRLNLSY